MDGADLDLECDGAATAVLDRARDDELYADLDVVATELATRGPEPKPTEAELMAALRSTLAANQAAAAGISALADQIAGKPPRKSRTLRIVRGDDGAMAAEDITEAPAPAAADVGEPAVPVSATPDGKLADAFGDPDAPLSAQVAAFLSAHGPRT
jgi:hypothetical protein